MTEHRWTDRRGGPISNPDRIRIPAPPLAFTFSDILFKFKPNCFGSVFQTSKARIQCLAIRVVLICQYTRNDWTMKKTMPNLPGSL
jgi:hypothetical protein